MKRLAGPTPRKPNTRSLGHSRRRASQGETEHPAFQEMMAAILVNGVKTAIVWMAWTGCSSRGSGNVSRSRYMPATFPGLGIIV